MDPKGYALWGVEGTQYPPHIAPPLSGEGLGWGQVFEKAPFFDKLRGCRRASSFCYGIILSAVSSIGRRIILFSGKVSAQGKLKSIIAWFTVVMRSPSPL